MAFAFDTLAYAKRLRDAGIPPQEAEAHAEAAREFIMAELVTKPDLAAVRADLQASNATTRRELEAAMETLGLRLTVRLGGMLAIGLSVMTAILGGLIRFR
ncbi:MAG TPA: hypothetical protein VND19_14435 [Acetobacteraceae bacterium]|nr:hypothetical protein [Acetobacteraceae bacterium]